MGSTTSEHSVSETTRTPIGRDHLGWADLVQFVTRKACERLVEREAEADER